MPQQFDLEERTFRATQRVYQFVRKLPRTITNIEIIKQLIRSSGSVGANYIEANEALSRNDFFFRIKISRKEAKETIYWLRLLEVSVVVQEEHTGLIREYTEIMKILGAIIEHRNLKTKV